MKKIFTVILVSILLAISCFVFASCGQDDTPISPKEPQKPTEIELPIIE